MKWFKKSIKDNDLIKDKLFILNEEEVSFSEILNGNFIPPEESLFKFRDFPILSIAKFWERTITKDLSTDEFQFIVFDSHTEYFNNIITNKLKEKTFFISENKHFELENLIIPVIIEAFDKNVLIQLKNEILLDIINYYNTFRFGKSVLYFDKKELSNINKSDLMLSLENKHPRSGSVNYQETKYHDFFNRNSISYHEELSKITDFLNIQGISDDEIDDLYVELILKKTSVINKRNNSFNINLYLEKNPILNKKNQFEIKKQKKVTSKYIISVLDWFLNLEDQIWYKEKDVSKKTFFNIFNIIERRVKKDKVKITKALRNKMIFFILRLDNQSVAASDIIFHPLVVIILKGELPSGTFIKLQNSNQSLAILILSIAKFENKSKLIEKIIRNKVYKRRKYTDFQVEKDLISFGRNMKKDFDFNIVKNKYFFYSKIDYLQKKADNIKNDIIKKSKLKDLVVFG